MGEQDGQEVCTLASKPSSLDSNPGPDKNRHPGVSQARRIITVYATPLMDDKLDVSICLY